MVVRKRGGSQERVIISSASQPRRPKITERGIRGPVTERCDAVGREMDPSLGRSEPEEEGEGVSFRVQA